MNSALIYIKYQPPAKYSVCTLYMKFLFLFLLPTQYNVYESLDYYALENAFQMHEKKALQSEKSNKPQVKG